jgi:hypothetical protein
MERSSPLRRGAQTGCGSGTDLVQAALCLEALTRTRSTTGLHELNARADLKASPP